MHFIDAADVGDLMQPWALTVDRFLTHAARWHGGRELVTRQADGAVTRTSYAEVERRARRFSGVLDAAGVVVGDRIATLAMNTSRHVEAWFGIMGIGAICHTLNPRLFEEQIVYIINHAADRWLVAEPQFAPLVERLRGQCPTLERIVYLCDSRDLPAGQGVVAYEDLLEAVTPNVPWGAFDEHRPASLCYTSGTTGNPKGVLYSHRSQVLHTYMVQQPDVLGFSRHDSLLLVVPMFHANAWGVPFAAAAAGVKLVLPGPRLDGESLYELLEAEAVTFAAGVPTVWQGLLDFLAAKQLRLSTLQRVLIGGSAVPESVVRALRDVHGAEVVHGWGMTELSPVGTTSTVDPTLPPERQVAAIVRQGRVPFGVDMKITDEAGARLPHDGVTPGNLKVQGPAIIARYYGESADALDAEGYFDTGDIGTIDAGGVLTITDRSKDVIKSGGEWISSVEIENLAAGHPKALLAAVIAMPHPKWRERPLLVVKLRPGTEATAEEFLAFLDGKIARWWMPDAVVFVDEMPLGATGKLDKKVLRARYAGATIP